MFGNFLKEAANLVEDLTTVAVAPAAVAVEMARQITAPAAEMAREVVKAVSDEPRKG